MSDGWVQAPFWSEWVKLTRLQWSGRIAFEREVALWRADSAQKTELPTLSDAGGAYRTSVARHIAALDNPTQFYELILLRSYSLMESHCKLVWHICAASDWSLLERGPDDAERERVDEIELPGGIDAWSNRLVSLTGQSWDKVYGGSSGLVEISVVRNALMHGYSLVSAPLIASAIQRGCVLPYSRGDALTIAFQQLHEYRGRMRSLCRVLSDGVVHLARGTHRNL